MNTRTKLARKGRAGKGVVAEIRVLFPGKSGWAVIKYVTDCHKSCGVLSRSWQVNCCWKTAVVQSSFFVSFHTQ